MGEPARRRHPSPVFFPVFLPALLLLLLCGLSFSQEIHLSVKEEQPAGTLVGSLAEQDWLAAAVAEDVRSSLRYSLLDSGLSHTDLFTINSTSGALRTTKRLDREQLCALYSPSCQLRLEAAAQSSFTQFFRMVNLLVEVEDVNDHSPVFPMSRYTLRVSENAALNRSMPLVTAEDRDTGVLGVQGYSLVASGSGGGGSGSGRGGVGGGAASPLPFVITVGSMADGTQQVSLLIRGKLDRETIPEYHLTLVARDGGEPPRTGSMGIDVKVEDVNDNPPIFHPKVLNVSLDETVSERSLIATLNVTDADREANGLRTFRFSPSMAPEVTRYFQLNATTGEIRVASPLTEMQGQKVQLQVECSDGGRPPMVGRATVEVRIADSGNTRPKAFLGLLFQGNVSEVVQPGFVVAHVRVVDPDAGLEGVVTCSVMSDALELQPLDVNRYKVIVVRSLDREQQATHEVTINCRDAGSPPLDTNVRFTVHVQDENDNAPEFEQDVYYASVIENNEIGVQVTRVRARDPDIGDNGKVDYTISSNLGDAGVFVDESGYVIATRSFDHERNHQLSFEVVATDRGRPKKQNSVTVILTVKDVNDITPSFKQDVYELRISEDTPVGSTVGRVSAEDRDSNENGRVRYSLAWENPQQLPFFSPQDSNIPLFVSPEGTLTLERRLDHEMTSEYRLLALATDNGQVPRTGTARITILVGDVNDNPPQIVVPDPHNVSALALATDTKPGSTLLVVVARDVDMPDSSLLHYHLAHATSFVRLNGRNGVLTLSRALKPRDIGRHRVTVVVTDSGEPRKASNASFDLVVFAANATDGSGGGGDKVEHLLIVVILGSVTGIITVAVIVTIVVIRRADQQRRKYRERDDVKPMGQKGAVEMGSALIVCSSPPPSGPVFSGKGHHHQHHPHLGGGGGGGGGGGDGGGGGGGGAGSPSPKDCTFEEDTFPDKSFSGGSVSQESQHSASEDQGGNGQWNKALRLHQDLLKLHGVDPGFLLQPDDGNSDASGESTTCDSGRGGSEEDSHSTGRLSPSSHHTDNRVGSGSSKLPRHLSTFHPGGGVTRPLRSANTGPSALRAAGGGTSSQDPHLTLTPASGHPPGSGSSSTSSSSSSYTENGQPVKKVSFQDDPTSASSRNRQGSLGGSGASPVGSQRGLGGGGGGGGVDRWQSPLLIGGGDMGPPPPPPPPSSAGSTTAALHYSNLGGGVGGGRAQYVNVGGISGGGGGGGGGVKGGPPRGLFGGGGGGGGLRHHDLLQQQQQQQHLHHDTSLDTGDDSTSTTTSGSYQVDLETFPAGGSRHLLDQNSVV